ncbi:MAG: hypothetical protein CM1200mP23_0080 [Nitrososphaerota archaeon]|nr:MAG: hypothetical protein CM1200mP23_0080 [Nitrososphaerota archaeon]
MTEYKKWQKGTAGKPIQIGVFVDKKSGYTLQTGKFIDVNVRLRVEKKKQRLVHTKDQRFRMNLRKSIL